MKKVNKQGDNKLTRKRNIVKCQCCNRRMRKVVRYECWHLDCQYNDFDGDNISENPENYKYKDEGEE